MSDEFYFEYPPRGGPIYAVSVRALEYEADVTRLKEDGQLVSLVRAKGAPVVPVPIEDVPTVFDQPGRVWDARLIVDHHSPADIVFGLDGWDDLIEPMLAVASVNAPWIIPLAPAEFRRLDAGGLDELKAMVPNVVAVRLSLQPGWPVGEEEMSILLVAHRGRCHSGAY